MSYNALLWDGRLFPLDRRLPSMIRCRARPENLDDPGAGRRTHELTDALIDTYDPGTLWATEGIRDDVVVREPYFVTRITPQTNITQCAIALYTQLPSCRYTQAYGPRPSSPDCQGHV